MERVSKDDLLFAHCSTSAHVHWLCAAQNNASIHFWMTLSSFPQNKNLSK